MITLTLVSCWCDNYENSCDRLSWVASHTNTDTFITFTFRRFNCSIPSSRLLFSIYSFVVCIKHYFVVYDRLIECVSNSIEINRGDRAGRKCMRSNGMDVYVTITFQWKIQFQFFSIYLCITKIHMRTDTRYLHYKVI